jgi:multidrug efflux pump subunit AcrA (membrane-fusion protein)
VRGASAPTESVHSVFLAFSQFDVGNSKIVKVPRIVSWFKNHIVVGTLLSLLILYTVYELLSGVLVYSRDAYITTDVIAVAPEISGPLAVLAVKDNQVIHQGDLLIRIKPEPFQLDLDRLQATRSRNLLLYRFRPLANSHRQNSQYCSGCSQID